MNVPTGAPETYQQWLECFQYLREHPGDHRVCALLTQGSMAGSIPESFRGRLSETISVMLSFHCRRFLKQLDTALEDGEPDMAELLAQRLRHTIGRCLFYRRMPFLEGDFVALLEDGYTKQLQGFWEDVLKQLRQIARETEDPALEDLLRALRRIRLT